MAIDSGYFETENVDMRTDDIATLLVKLYAEFRAIGGYDDSDKYAEAVGVAIRMLHDYE